MGHSLKHLSIRIKLTLIMVAASSVGLIITATTFIVREGPIFRTSMSRDLQSLASVLGANSAAPLAFGDQKFATELLSALRAVPHVGTAVLYDASGRPFAEYRHVGPRPAEAHAGQHEKHPGDEEAIGKRHSVSLPGRPLQTRAAV